MTPKLLTFDEFKSECLGYGVEFNDIVEKQYRLYLVTYARNLIHQNGHLLTVEQLLDIIKLL